MANNGTGYVDPTGANGPTGVPYDTVELQIGVTDQVGELKLGAIDTVPGSNSGASVRKGTVTFSVTTTTQQTIAHNFVDENGNPAVPTDYGLLVTNQATTFFSQEADDTNFYITATGASTASTATGTIWGHY